MKQQAAKASAGMSLAMLLWAGSTVATRYIVGDIPPLRIALIREAVSFISFLILLLAFREKLFVRRKDIGLIALATVTGLVLFQAFANLALNYISAALVSIIYATVPVLTMLLEALFMRQRMGPSRIVAVLVSAVGIYMVYATQDCFAGASNLLLGSALAFGAALMWAAGILLDKKLMESCTNVQLNFWSHGMAVLLLVPMTLLEKPMEAAPGAASLAINIVYLGLVTGVLANLLNMYSIKRMSATLSSLYVNLMPVFSVALSFFLLGERILPLQIGGMAVILLSIGILVYGDTRNAAAQAAEDKRRIPDDDLKGEQIP